MSKTSKFGSTQRINHDSSRFYGIWEENDEISSQAASNLAKLPSSTRIPHRLPRNEEVSSIIPLDTIINASSENMHHIPDNVVHLMVTSPPYNVGKEYDNNDGDTRAPGEYLNMLYRVMAEVYRVLVDGGRACVNVANLGRKPYIPLSSYVNMMMLDIGFKMRGEIIWNKSSGAGVSMAWGSWKSASNPVLRDTHEYILIFSKGKYGRKGGESTISSDEFMEWTKSVWEMKPESAKRIGHPAPFPIELPRRLIHLYTFVGDTVLDPFMGSGTTALAAMMTNRHYIGYEIEQKYIDIAADRIKKAPG